MKLQYFKSQRINEIHKHFKQVDTSKANLQPTQEKDSANQVQILDEAVCISLSANALRKSMKQSILLPAICKYCGMVTNLRGQFKTVELCS